MNAQVLIKRAYVFLVLSLLAVAAYFQALGLVKLLGVMLAPGGGAVGIDSASRRSTPSAPPLEGEASVGRNIFDSTSTRTLEGEPSAPAPNIGHDPLAWPSCDGLELLIVSEAREPAWSLASLRAAGKDEARLVRVGDSVAERQIAFIGWNPRVAAPAVWLEGTADACQAVLFHRPLPDVEPLAAPPLTERAPRGPAGPPLREALRGPATALGSLRVVPEAQGNAVVGLRLFGVRPGSVLHTLGIRNGDRLETINGMSLASPEQALNAYAKLRTASRLLVHLERRGAPSTSTIASTEALPGPPAASSPV